MGEEKRRYDKEYSTSFLDEVLWLRSHGIRYTWVYRNEYGISVWKYEKSYRLWNCLAQMYKQKRYISEKERGADYEKTKLERCHC